MASRYVRAVHLRDQCNVFYGCDKGLVGSVIIVVVKFLVAVSCDRDDIWNISGVTYGFWTRIYPGLVQY